MVKPFESFSDNEIKKAGYNQAQRITETLAMLRNSYVGSMIEDDFTGALKVCRRVVDIISAKMKKDDLKTINKRIYVIAKFLPKANETFTSEGARYYKNSRIRKKIEVAIENLWRRIEQVQDKHGYGMLAEEEYGL